MEEHSIQRIIVRVEPLFGLGSVLLVFAISMAACALSSSETVTPRATQTQMLMTEGESPTLVASALPQPTIAIHTASTLLRPEQVVSSGDVADWPGGWSPDGRFYVYFRFDVEAGCSGETVYAYDVKLKRDILISSEDYCTRSVDPDAIWDGDSVLLFGNGPDGSRWEAITLDDEVQRVELDGPPPSCIDRAYPVPDVLSDYEVIRTRLSPDEIRLAVAITPDDESYRFDDISGNRPDLQLFQRLDVAVIPIGSTNVNDLQLLGPVFDLGPDAQREEDCPGTQIRWSDNGRFLISSMGPFAYDTASGEAVLAPDGPNSGLLGPDVRWSPDDLRLADDQIMFDLTDGQLHQLPGILRGFDRGFAGNNRLIYVADLGLVEYDVTNRSARQLTDFTLVVFVVAPAGGHLAYADAGNLWILELPE